MYGTIAYIKMAVFFLFAGRWGTNPAQDAGIWYSPVGILVFDTRFRQIKTHLCAKEKILRRNRKHIA